MFTIFYIIVPTGVPLVEALLRYRVHEICLSLYLYSLLFLWIEHSSLNLTKVLAEFYEQLKEEDENALEIIFASSDQDQVAFDEYK